MHSVTKSCSWLLHNTHLHRSLIDRKEAPQSKEEIEPGDESFLLMQGPKEWARSIILLSFAILF